MNEKFRIIYTDRGMYTMPMGTAKQAGMAIDDGLVMVSFGPSCFEARNGSRHTRTIDCEASGLGVGVRTIKPSESPRWFDEVGYRKSLEQDNV